MKRVLFVSRAIHTRFSSCVIHLPLFACLECVESDAKTYFMGVDKSKNKYSESESEEETANDDTRCHRATELHPPTRPITHLNPRARAREDIAAGGYPPDISSLELRDEDGIVSINSKACFITLFVVFSFKGKRARQFLFGASYVRAR